MTRRNKIGALFALFMLFTLLISGCAKEFTCDFCDETKKSQAHSIEIYGEKLTVCDDCYQELKDLAG